MRKVAPFRSIYGISYHIYKECQEGNNIETRNLLKGKGGLKLCNRCRDLSDPKASEK